MKITYHKNQSVTVGDENYFTGSVHIELPFQAPEPARVGGASVTFDAGARTAWHTHPLGQTLIVTSGAGWVQEEGKEKFKITKGDIVWIPENIKHWHGAAADTKMTHIAIAESLNGSAVVWLEKVSDSQYEE